MSFIFCNERGSAAEPFKAFPPNTHENISFFSRRVGREVYVAANGWMSLFPFSFLRDYPQHIHNLCCGAAGHKLSSSAWKSCHFTGTSSSNHPVWPEPGGSKVIAVISAEGRWSLALLFFIVDTVLHWLETWNRKEDITCHRWLQCCRQRSVIWRRRRRRGCLFSFFFFLQL